MTVWNEDNSHQSTFVWFAFLQLEDNQLRALKVMIIIVDKNEITAAQALLIHCLAFCVFAFILFLSKKKASCQKSTKCI